MKLKWITAIVIIFGLLLMFYMFKWTVVLKSSLIFSCVVLIGCVLLQAGRGGGLAAIGGLADQSALGTQTGGVLVKVTYLVGAVFIVSTIMLTKLTVSSFYGTDTFQSEISTSFLQEIAHEHAGHDHSQVATEETGGGGDYAGMSAADDAGNEQKNNEDVFKPIVEDKKND